MLYTWYNKTGGFIGSIRMFDSLLLENVIHKGNVTAGYNKVGGLVGEITMYSRGAGDNPPRATEVIVKNAHAEGEITPSSSAGHSGGLIGRIYFVDNIEISNSSFKGRVAGNSQHLGGFIGDIMQAYSVKIKDSSVNAHISASCYGNEGGFVGTIISQDTLLENLTFRGKITGACQGVGGLVGTFRSTPENTFYMSPYYSYMLNNPTVEIKNCYVEGEISTGSWGGYLVGGLVGRAFLGDKDGLYADFTEMQDSNIFYDIKILNSGVKASIDAVGTRIGGLVGKADYLTIENSFYEGDMGIDTDGYFLIAGGLVGEVDEISISESYSRANVTVEMDPPSCTSGLFTDHYFGGILGRAHENATINNTYYAGVTNICNLASGNCIPVDTTVYPNTLINAVAGSTNETTMQRVYYDRLLTDLTDSLATSRKTSEMKDYNKDTYVGWDFDKIWGMTMLLNDGYPILLFPEGIHDTEYTVHYTSTTGGSVSPSNRKVYPGTISEAPEAIASEGYAFVNFTIEIGSYYGALNPITGEVSNVIGPMTIRANFKSLEGIDQEDEICEAPSGRLYGDINNDGIITKEDRILLTNYVLEIEDLDAESLEAGDLNGDGKVNVQDVTLLEKYLIGLIDTFPVCIEEFVCGDKLIDPRDLKEYSTIELGQDCWMSENLNFVSKNSWCYDYNSSNCNTYGRLYTWSTAKNICPHGWSLPAWNKFSALINTVGGQENGSKLKSSLWDGNNESGFSALPAGSSTVLLSEVEHNFEGFGEKAVFWSSDVNQYDSTLGRMMMLLDYNEDYEHGIFVGSEDKFTGFSVRCVKD
jgi:uncharacterized protein (TIGR02145 family)